MRANGHRAENPRRAHGEVVRGRKGHQEHIAGAQIADLEGAADGVEVIIMRAGDLLGHAGGAAGKLQKCQFGGGNVCALRRGEWAFRQLGPPGIRGFIQQNGVELGLLVEGIVHPLQVAIGLRGAEVMQRGAMGSKVQNLVRAMGGQGENRDGSQVPHGKERLQVGHGIG